VAALVLAAPALAAAPLAKKLARALASPHVEPSRSAAIALDLATGKVVFAHQAGLSLAPASNEKLAVTYAALVRLGPAFRFRTEVLGEGAREGRVWQGNLVLRGYGDPTLKTHGLKRLAAQLKTSGIRQVTGSVVGDESFFDSRRMVGGWKASFYVQESPPLSALAINRGRVKGMISDDPALATALRFRELLVERGIAVGGGVEMRAAAPEAFPLASLYSESLAEIVQFMNHESDNYTAELLLKELGAVVRAEGTSVSGAKVVVDALAAANVPLAGVRIVDGSGLSRSDRLTARALASILRAAWLDPALRTTFFRALPVAGVSGTLERRFERGPAYGLVRAKTGTTAIACSLAGYVGTRYVFAILQNGHPVWSWYAREAQDRFVETLAASAQ
jgi:D-alanyl-D-alanine carboxypeptidase/D-alanyl-D-alanine-endopeptidase (penicillin-binding protein 4)